ncbi:MAG: hypothetical protein OXG81_13265 [Acidobacteria bacterium]|nr:hypothetical protein [Acidobacteriota bacterium]
MGARCGVWASGGRPALADDAPIATSNEGDFSRFAAAGLKLA